MNPRMLVRLVVVALVALVAALWLGSRRGPNTELEGHKALVPGLKDALNDVTVVKLTGAANKAIATLEKGEKGWHVAERGGYSADSAKVREFMLKLADGELIEAKTATPELHKKLGVEDPAQSDATSVQVELVGGKAATKLVIGRFNGMGGDGTFVRAAGDNQAWLAKGNLTVDKQPSDWLRKELVDIPSSRIESVQITREGKTLTASKAKPSDANYTVAEVPKGRELTSETSANGLASVLSGLRLDDVFKRGDVPEPEGADVRAVRYAGWDGLVVSGMAWEKDGKAYAHFEASLVEAKAKDDIREQQARDKADFEARKAEFEAKAKAEPAKPEAATPVQGAATAAAPPTAAELAIEKAKAEPPAEPLAVTDPAKDEELRLGRLRQEVQDLNAKFQGWIFVLPSFKYANINRGVDELLKPLPQKGAPAKDLKTAATKT